MYDSSARLSRATSTILILGIIGWVCHIVGDPQQRNMGRGKIKLKKIENTVNRQVTFAKRKGGLLKKARELSILCAAEVALIIFSTTGRLFEFSSSSMKETLKRYLCISGKRLWDHQHLISEMATIKKENERLRNALKHVMGNDLNSLSIHELQHLEQSLEIAKTRVRTRKNQHILEEMESLRKKERSLHRHYNLLTRILARHDGPETVHMTPVAPTFRAQPIQPNLQDIVNQETDLQLGISCAQQTQIPLNTDLTLS
eukprot:Gb_28587 [translate_table: standard]